MFTKICMHASVYAYTHIHMQIEIAMHTCVHMYLLYTTVDFDRTAAAYANINGLTLNPNRKRNSVGEDISCTL